MNKTALTNRELDVFRKYAGLSLPRHVSYPMPTGWTELDEASVSTMQQEARNREPVRDLSLYLHIPFCEELCRYCACTRTIQTKTAPSAADRTKRYVEALTKEIRQWSVAAGTGRTVRQIHWGGGTPIYLDPQQIAAIHETIADSVDIATDAEIAAEIDPRRAGGQVLEDLRNIGFNRLSFGVQDFNQQVQEHVHRIQPYEMIAERVGTARKLGFASINFDLIYGLPFQTIDTIRRTLEQTIELNPDRIAYYHYAQIPDKIATQRGLDYTKLPDSEIKLSMFLAGLQMLEEAGYLFIGLDHFAKPHEPLAKALQNGTLQRNFQGMTTGGGLDLIGAGATSISHLSGIGFLQNVHNLNEYIEAISADQPVIRRGRQLSFDDCVRQAVMTQLYCTASIEPGKIEQAFDIVFANYFARELQAMNDLEMDGLVELESDGQIRVTCPLGRVLMRNVAAVFDAYLEPDAYKVGDKRCFSANA